MCDAVDVVESEIIADRVVVLFDNSSVVSFTVSKVDLVLISIVVRSVSATADVTVDVVSVVVKVL